MSKIKTKDELILAAGERLAGVLMRLRKGSWTKYPYSVTLATKKPSFALNDGGTLHCYLLDLTDMSVLAEHYGGSNDSIINHTREQLSEGATPPEDFGYLFIETYWNGRNMGWFATLVTPHKEKID